MKITKYKDIKEISNGVDISLNQFLRDVKEGTYQDKVLKVRNAKSKDEYSKLKRELLPYVTISGTFDKRANKGLKQHSGLIAIDIDDIPQDEFQEVRNVLINDPYSYSVFTSVGGFGFVVLVRIEGNKHLQAFEALEDYYFKNYHVIIDTSCKDVARARFVTYDPDLYLNQNAQTFTSYLPKKPIQERKPQKYVFSQTDVNLCFEQIQNRGIDIVKGDYKRWLNIGFGIADTLGEDGRAAFHMLSQFDGKYNSKTCDKQYDKCLKAKNSGVTIATFFYYCKEEGLSIQSEQTIRIASAAIQAKAAKTEKENAVESISQLQNIESKNEVLDIVNQVYENDNIKSSDLKPVEQLETFLDMNYKKLLYNEITTRIEYKETTLSERGFNEIWRNANKTIEKAVSFEMVKRVITSDYTKSYNPVKSWFEAQADKKERGHIKALADSIKTNTGLKNDEFFPDYAENVLKSWLVGMVSMVYGTHSPLLLMLVGEKQGTGKTEFFRRLLPRELHKNYFAECKFVQGKDDFILMCEKLIILNDEFDGKTVNNEKQMKQILSAQSFNIRAPYSSFSENRQRLAAICGTSNETNFLKDPTGNRRILPIEVLGIDFEKYNSVNKTKLLIEAYQLFNDGFEWELKGKYLEKFNEVSNEFNYDSIEHELISSYLILPIEGMTAHIDSMTATDLITYLEGESNNKKISKRKLCLELSKFGFKQKVKKINGKAARLWEVIKK